MKSWITKHKCIECYVLHLEFIVLVASLYLYVRYGSHWSISQSRAEELWEDSGSNWDDSALPTPAVAEPLRWTTLHYLHYSVRNTVDRRVVKIINHYFSAPSAGFIHPIVLVCRSTVCLHSLSLPLTNISWFLNRPIIYHGERKHHPTRRRLC